MGPGQSTPSVPGGRAAAVVVLRGQRAGMGPTCLNSEHPNSPPVAHSCSGSALPPYPVGPVVHGTNGTPMVGLFFSGSLRAGKSVQDKDFLPASFSSPPFLPLFKTIATMPSRSSLKCQRSVTPVNACPHSQTLYCLRITFSGSGLQKAESSQGPARPLVPSLVSSVAAVPTSVHTI